MNSEKLRAGGGAHIRIRNSLESARLHFYFRPRNRGKGGEVVKVGIALLLGSCGHKSGREPDSSRFVGITQVYV